MIRFCLVCGKRFETKDSTTHTVRAKRPKNSKTCSRRCSVLKTKFDAKIYHRRKNANL